MTTELFPEELEGVAVSLDGKGTEDLRLPLAEAIAVGIYDGYGRVREGDNSYLSDYQRLSVVLGREVRFIRNGISESGVAEDIDGDGGLVVIKDGGERITLSGGEITLRLINEGDLHEER